MQWNVSKRPPKESAERYFWNFQENLKVDTQGFVARLRQAGVLEGPAYTVESLDAAEQFFLSHIEAPADLEEPDGHAVFMGTFRYLGETILRNAGGDWEWEELWEEKAEGAGLPFLRVDSPEKYDGGGTVNVYTTVLGAAGNRTGTDFRTLVEAIVASFGEAGPLKLMSGWRGMDLAEPERSNPTLAAYLAEEESVLAEWTAARSAYGRLDFTPESLDAVERWLLDTYPTADELEDDVDQPEVRGLTRYVARTFVKNGGGRVDVVHPPHLELVRRVKPEDAHPTVRHVWERGCAGKYVELWDVALNAVDELQMGDRPPRAGDVLRTELAKYSAEEPDIDN